MNPLIRPLKEAVRRSPLWAVLRPRRLHAYNLGAGRTGTTTMAAIFSDSYRSAHEPMAPETIGLLEQYWSGEVTPEETREALRARDRARRIEFESSPFLGPFAHLLPRVFPDSRYILTVRSPRRWLRSNIDKCVNSPRSEVGSHWVALRDLSFGPPPEDYPEPEAVLAQHDLHSLSGYLEYWSRHNEHVLGSVPRDRLLVLWTSELSDSISRIAAFTGVDEGKLSRPERRNRAPERHGILDRVDDEYLDELIGRHCAGTLRRLEECTSA